MAFNIKLLVLGLLVAFVYFKYNQLTKPLPLPKIDTNKYWGPGDGSNYKADVTIKPFKVQRNVQEIEDLRSQLNRTLAYTAPLEGIKFEYGFNSLALKQIVDYWRDDFLPRWKEREAFLNSLPQYTTEIQGLRIHFLHAKPNPKKIQGKKVLPLLLLHGWPGSVREFYEFIPMLTEPNEYNDYVFEVVAPSLVGYGWSDAAAKPDFNCVEMAIVMHKLMQRLGYKRFLVQGGDWGAIIANQLSTVYADSVLAYHTNMCWIVTPLNFLKTYVAEFAPKYFIPENGYDHHFPFAYKIQYLIQETGYLHLQATKPDTIGAALLNNPTGLAAYILEKFQLLSPYNNDLDALERTFTLDAVLDNVMIYQLSNTATTAARFYAENGSKKFAALQMDRVISPVQYGCARFLHDLPPAIDWAIKDKFPNLVHSTYYTEGGHFAALEVPHLLWKDFMQFLSHVKIL